VNTGAAHNVEHEALVNRTLHALAERPRVRAFALKQGGARRRGGGRLVRFGLVKGASDILGLLSPGGRLFAIEIKTGTGRLSKEQTAFLAMVQSFGGIAVEARSLEAALAPIDAALSGVLS
jgi:hypothetical protein